MKDQLFEARLMELSKTVSALAEEERRAEAKVQAAGNRAESILREAREGAEKVLLDFEEKAVAEKNSVIRRAEDEAHARAKRIIELAGEEAARIEAETRTEEIVDKKFKKIFLGE